MIAFLTFKIFLVSAYLYGRDIGFCKGVYAVAVLTDIFVKSIERNKSFPLAVRDIFYIYTGIGAKVDFRLKRHGQKVHLW